ncbi:class I SAM-dependent methyltransferase [Catellatospora sp. KI3]|uniref:class I SAM-dependent methyltransferase n=1 Tax=Catellatospora sp. KI3 TaxID=3041620 RepID=UPI002483241B|nr:class I SAM-dependent methyltransferase [Catellatospora sp. KI3]MDI1466032.1 class I SAM-dependent methyltransferase [Catellatospora sp. KI3]
MDADDIRAATAVENRHWWYRERRAIIARELRRIGTPGKAVEIGASGGGNSQTLRDMGWDVLVTEYIQEGVDIARQRGFDAIQADARDLPLADGSFDLLVAFDVLEHIEEDDQAAAEIHRVLRPGGTALIAVPCDMELWSKHDVATGHFRRYDRAGLVKLMEGAGMVVETLWSWNVLLRPVVKLRRRNADDAQNEHDIVAVPWLVNFGLGLIIKFERLLPVKNRRGVSLMMRAVKPM